MNTQVDGEGQPKLCKPTRHEITPNGAKTMTKVKQGKEIKEQMTGKSLIRESGKDFDIEAERIDRFYCFVEEKNLTQINEKKIL